MSTIDSKRYKETQPAGIFETPLPTYSVGDPVILHFDDRGRLLVSIGESSVTADVDTDQSAGPATPNGQYVLGKREATLPTYADGANSVFHMDERGRLITTLFDLASGNSASVSTEDAAGPANPVGSFPLGLYRSTLPTYTAGDSAVMHFDATGRLYTTVVDPTTGATGSVSTEDSAGPANPIGTYPMGLYRSTLPTYTAGDSAIMHFDAKGRLYATVVDPTTGATASVSTEDSAAPANPVGTYQLGVYRATMPAYTDGDAAVQHFTAEGLLKTETLPSQIAQTYYAAFSVQNPNGVSFEITGSASRTVRVTKLFLTTTYSSIATVNVTSTAQSGGTSSAANRVPLDSTNTSATAVVRSYTVAPTAGSVVGALAIMPNAVAPFTLTFGDDNGQQPVILAGTAQTLVINMDTASGGATELLVGYVEWIEE